MKAQKLYDYLVEWPICSGKELSEFFTEQVNEPSPPGATAVDSVVASEFIIERINDMRWNSPSQHQFCFCAELAWCVGLPPKAARRVSMIVTHTTRVRWVKAAKNWRVRREVVPSIFDLDELTRIALEDPSVSVRLAAVKCLVSPYVDTVARDCDTNWAVRLAAMELVGNTALLHDLALNEPDERVKGAAEQRLRLLQLYS